MTNDEPLVSLAQMLGMIALIVAVPAVTAVVIVLNRNWKRRQARKRWQAHMANVPKLSPSQRDFLHRCDEYRRINGIKT